MRGRGNTEGTRPRASAGTRDHSFSGDSFFLRGFRARGCPALPARSVSSLDGKEGVDGSSPSEGFAEFLQTGQSSCPTRKRLSRAGTRGHSLMFPRIVETVRFALEQTDPGSLTPFLRSNVVASARASSVCQSAALPTLAPGVHWYDSARGVPDVSRQARARSSAARSVGSPCVGSTNSTGLSSSGLSPLATCSTVTPSGSQLAGISSPLPRSISVSPAITA